MDRDTGGLRKYYDGDVNLPTFLTAKNLRTFIPSDFGATSKGIEFKPLSGGPETP